MLSFHRKRMALLLCCLQQRWWRLSYPVPDRLDFYRQTALLPRNGTWAGEIFRLQNVFLYHLLTEFNLITVFQSWIC